MTLPHNTRVVVGIDFGTTFSGFAYAHVLNPIITTHNEWPGQSGPLKTNTALSYDSSGNVECWGYPALIKNPKQDEPLKLAELFKLHLSGIPTSDECYRPYDLNSKLDYKKVITDYLREMGKLIKKTVTTRWPGIESYQMFYVLAVPAEFPEKSKEILRECAYHAKLIDQKKTSKLQFTTEPEAAALHCLDVMENSDYMIGKSYLVVDCGGGSVDLTIRKLSKEKKLSEVTVRTGDLCGGIYVDQEFVNFLTTKVGESAMNLLKKNKYGKYQYLIHEFHKCVKLPFTGDEKEDKVYELDLEEICPALKQYVTGPEKIDLKDEEWVIKLRFQDVKRMFDPSISKIIRLINGQLNADKTCSIIFLVGGFSESKYLQKRIKKEFSGRVEQISVKDPVAAVVRGALRYGLNKGLIKSRVLKYTYGRSTLRDYNEKIDPIERKRESGQVLVFKLLAQKGTRVEVNQKFSQTSCPENSDQTEMWYQLLITDKDNAKYCDEEGVKPLGDCVIELPDAHLGNDRKVHFELCFGEMEIQATARNEYNNKVYRTKFDFKF